MLFLCSSTWGYTSLAVARWIHPRLHAAAAPQLRRLLSITPLIRTVSRSCAYSPLRCSLNPNTPFHQNVKSMPKSPIIFLLTFLLASLAQAAPRTSRPLRETQHSADHGR